MKLAIVAIAGALTFAATNARATDFQGVLADWNCAKEMVDKGREKTLKHNHNCSMDTEYSRAAYGLITADKKYYRLDDAGRAWALKLLKDTHDKDNLKVSVTGDLQGDTIHVTNMTEL